jgi:hypothetical protein
MLAFETLVQSCWPLMRHWSYLVSLMDRCIILAVLKEMGIITIVKYLLSVHSK